MTDPRDVNRLIGQHIHHIYAVLPLSGLHMPGQSVRESLRELIRRFLAFYELDKTLRDLVYRIWSKEWPPAEGLPHQNCLRPGCSGVVNWSVRFGTTSKCDHCGEQHWLSDYLGLIDNIGEERSRAEIIENFRRIAEALTLFTFVLRYRDYDDVMARTLFLLDGPLLLRAQLSRLVEPIRDFIENRRILGQPLYLAGVEKDGDFCAYATSIAPVLGTEGDFSLPDVRFLVEEIAGNNFDPATYRNRVNYGAKVAMRVGPSHTLAINIPTGKFCLNPKPDGLVGFAPIARTLARVTSTAHENAVIPLVEINRQASIAHEPSGSLLQAFVDRLVAGGHLK